MGIKNSTATFTQSWGSTQGRLVRVEVLVVFSALIWILVEFFGSRRRRYSQGFSRFFVWAVYTLFTVLGPYTIGLLQDGPFRDQTFVLWGTILLLIQVSVDSISVYSIHDIEQRKRMHVQHLIQIILVLWLIVNCKCHNITYAANIWIFWIHSVILAYRKYKSLSNASKKGGLLKVSKAVADYMMIEHEQIPRGFNPGTMEGYKYIFHGEEQEASLLPTAPEYAEATRRKCTTIDSVWRWIESQSALNQEAMETLKDVALSFSLFKLLKRRLCEYQIGEAGQAKTLDFVLKGLISEQGNYVRAFGVIETELSFLYDFLYTGFDTEYTRFKHLTGWFVVITVTVSNSISGAFSRHYHRSSLEQRVHGIDVTRWVTIVLLIIVLALFLLVLVSTDWRWDIVIELHSHRQPTLVTGLTKTSCVKREAKKWWQRALGQHSLLLNFDYHPRNVLSFLSLGLVDPTREGQKAGEKIKLTYELIERVLYGFKKSNGQLQDGQSALAKNQLGSQFSWACTLSTHIHKILVWHIGTTIAMDGHPVPLTGDHRIAKTLSDYCAYLVAFVPDMLPGHRYDTECIFDAMVVEAREIITGCDSISSRCEKLVTADWPSNNRCTILQLGGRLGRELRGIPVEQRWKVLADFWAEFILFLAPSSKVEIHTEMLAAGGEFMTHLWALLTHAGILERPSMTDGVRDNNGAPAQDLPV